MASLEQHPAGPENNAMPPPLPGAASTASQPSAQKGILIACAAAGTFVLLLGGVIAISVFTYWFNRGSETGNDAKNSGAVTTTTAAPLKATNAEVQKSLDEGTRAYQAGDMTRAFQHFSKAAENGHSGAQLQMGWFYENGAGVSQSYRQAAEWYRKAADQGNVTAMKNLGQLYENGQGVPEDWVLAAQWYRRGAEKNGVEAESAMGRAYQFGIGVPQDRQVSQYWNERAFAHGDAEAERWVRWLRDPTNNIGFRNPEEQSLVMGNRLRTSGLLLGADPVGWLFHNSEERLAWLRGLRNAVDADEAANRKRMAEFERQHAEASRRRHEDEVHRLESQGYSHDAAESRAGW
jgi:TPR repeat protein